MQQIGTVGEAADHDDHADQIEREWGHLFLQAGDPDSGSRNRAMTTIELTQRSPREGAAASEATTSPGLVCVP
jgi:hypothetical protein